MIHVVLHRLCKVVAFIAARVDIAGSGVQDMRT